MMMDAVRSNKLTNEQANTNNIMNDYNEQVQANSINSVETPRKEESGEDDHDRGKLNPWPAIKNTGKDDDISIKYFNKSMETKVVGDRDKSGGSTGPTCSAHAPDRCGLDPDHTWPEQRRHVGKRADWGPEC